MMKKSISLLMFLFFFINLSLLSFSFDDVKPVNGCVFITLPGYYALNKSIFLNKFYFENLSNRDFSCFKLNSNNVTFDCQGKTIDVSFFPFKAGHFTLFDTNYKNITIKNCNIHAQPYKGFYSFYMSGSNNTIENISLLYDNINYTGFSFDNKKKSFFGFYLLGKNFFLNNISFEIISAPYTHTNVLYTPNKKVYSLRLKNFSVIHKYYDPKNPGVIKISLYSENTLINNLKVYSSLQVQDFVYISLINSSISNILLPLRTAFSIYNSSIENITLLGKQNNLNLSFYYTPRIFFSAFNSTIKNFYSSYPIEIFVSSKKSLFNNISVFVTQPVYKEQLFFLNCYYTSGSIFKNVYFNLSSSNISSLKGISLQSSNNNTFKNFKIHLPKNSTGLDLFISENNSFYDLKIFSENMKFYKAPNTSFYNITFLGNTISVEDNCGYPLSNETYYFKNVHFEKNVSYPKLLCSNVSIVFLKNVSLNLNTNFSDSSNFSLIAKNSNCNFEKKYFLKNNSVNITIPYEIRFLKGGKKVNCEIYTFTLYSSNFKNTFLENISSEEKIFYNAKPKTLKKEKKTYNINTSEKLKDYDKKNSTKTKPLKDFDFNNSNLNAKTDFKKNNSILNYKNKSENNSIVYSEKTTAKKTDDIEKLKEEIISLETQIKELKKGRELNENKKTIEKLKKQIEELKEKIKEKNCYSDSDCGEGFVCDFETASCVEKKVSFLKYFLIFLIFLFFGAIGYYVLYMNQYKPLQQDFFEKNKKNDVKTLSNNLYNKNVEKNSNKPFNVVPPKKKPIIESEKQKKIQELIRKKRLEEKKKEREEFLKKLEESKLEKKKNK